MITKQHKKAFDSIFSTTKNYISQKETKDEETLHREYDNIFNLMEESFKLTELPNLKDLISKNLKDSYKNGNTEDFEVFKEMKSIFSNVLFNSIFSLAESDFEVTNHSVADLRKNDETIYSLLNCLSNDELKSVRNKLNYNQTNYLNIISYDNVPTDVLIDGSKKLNAIQKIKSSIVSVLIDHRIEDVKEINAKYSNGYYKAEELVNMGNLIQDDFREMDFEESFIASQKLLGKLLVAESEIDEKGLNNDSAKANYDAISFINNCYEIVDDAYNNANDNVETSEM